LFLGLWLGLVAGCTWVKLSPEGQRVALVPAGVADNCREIGKTTVSVLADVKGIQRSRDKVARELLILGRNSAAEMGGDTIVAVTEVMDGDQTFTVYRCR